MRHIEYSTTSNACTLPQSSDLQPPEHTYCWPLGVMYAPRHPSAPPDVGLNPVIPDCPTDPYAQAVQDVEAQHLLLKEVNHRVKNNLGSILTLINVEKMALLSDDPPKTVLQILSDLSARVRNLLALHEMLAAAQWKSLPAQRLIGETAQAALCSSPICDHIRLQIVSAGPAALWIVPSAATNVALVINELVTNSVKHAFNGRSQGRIAIRLTATAVPGCLGLRYEDDGPGWPADVRQGRRENFGLGLIRSVAHNQLTLTNQGGACADLIFNDTLSLPADDDLPVY